MTAEAVRFAQSSGVPLGLPEEVESDFGGLVRRRPAFVLRPRDAGELQASVRFLAGLGLPWIARGTGHSSAGQATLEGGAILDTRGLGRVLDDDGELVRVEGGALWIALADRLADSGRRPTVLTDNLYTTVGGTLSVGGVGDTSHVEGWQTDGVSALTLVTPDGELHSLGGDDPLFGLALRGRGLAGVIADVTLRTLRRPRHLAARVMRFPTLPAFLSAARGLAADRRWEFLRARLFWHRDRDENPVSAVIGAFATDPAQAVPADLAGAVGASVAEVIDLAPVQRADPRPSFPPFAPCAELILPLARAEEIWAAIDPLVRARRLPDHIPRGSSVVLVAPDALVIALRPELGDRGTAETVAFDLQEIAARALALGARIYPIGEDPAGPPEALRELRARYP